MGARFKAYEADEAARASFHKLRNGLAEDAELHMADFEAASDPTSGRPFELYIDASDIGWGCCVGQRATRKRRRCEDSVGTRADRAT